MFSDLRFRLRALFDRRAMERELDDELRFHLEQEVTKHMRAGVPAAEAARRARMEFGGLERIKDDTRDARGVALLDALRQDVRYALRGLRAKPGFTAAVVVTLGLGIGANTAMFGIVDRLLFRPPAYMTDTERVHRVYMPYLWNGEERIDGGFSYTRYQELVHGTNAFEVFAALSYSEMAIGTGEASRSMRVARVSASLFDFFNAQPVLGRFFTAAEDVTPAGAPVAVLGHAFWTSNHGARRDVLGEQMHIGSQVFTIIGVAPPDFVGVTEGSTPVAFIPVTTYASSRDEGFHRTHNWSWLDLIARRRPDVSVEAASAELSAAFARSWDDELRLAGGGWPAAEAARVRGIAAPVHEGRGPDAELSARIVTWVMGVAVIVLLVACANVANLLLARGAARRREVALRLALGVTRRRLLQQLLTESMIIAVLGGTAGLMVAQWGGRALRLLFLPSDDPAAVVTDGRTLLFSLVVTLSVALLTGIAPALHAVRGDAASSLKAGMREGVYRSSRTRTALLLFQGALSVVLLIGAGLFVRSLANVRALRLGYDAAPIVVVEANLRGAELTTAEEFALVDRLVAAAQATPGVRAATEVSSIPFYSFEARGIPEVPGVDSLRGRFIVQAASPSYFATMGTRILRGRGIETGDRAGSTPVVVLSAAMAEAIWPAQDALGKQMRVGNDTLPYLTVVGIAEDVRGRGLDDAAEYWYYIPADQHRAMFASPNTTIAVRVDGNAEEYIETLRARLQPEMPGDGYVTMGALADLVARTQRSWEFGATMFTAFGALALVLAAIGLYSVIAYAVTQRSHEIGIRVALGAAPFDVVRMVVRQGVAFAAVGIVLGSVLALWAGRWIEPLLFEQSPYDVRVFAAVAALMLLVATAATLRPTWRAAHVDPTVTLRVQ